MVLHHERDRCCYGNYHAFVGPLSMKLFPFFSDRLFRKKSLIRKCIFVFSMKKL